MAETLTPKALAEMPAPELAAAWARVNAARKAAADRCDLVHAELERRYRRRAERALKQAGKSCGAVHVIDDAGGAAGAQDVEVTFPGTDQVDQAAMALALARVEKIGTPWRDFVKVEYAVTRTVLKSLPDKVRALLEPAIATKIGKLRFTLRPAKPAALKKAA